MPSPVAFRVVTLVLSQHGWTLVRIKGSHHHFKKEGEPRLITVAVHRGKAPPVYIKQIKKDHGIDCG